MSQFNGGKVDGLLLESLNDTNPKGTTKAIVKLYPNGTFNSLEDLCIPQKNDRLEHHLSHLDIITGEFCSVTIMQMSEHSGVKKIYHDQKVQALLDVASPAVGATTVKNSYGLTGKGVAIAIVDTGIYPHPDLTRPTNRIIAFKDFINGGTSPYDDNGHGTHVAGDAASNGFSSGGKYAGPAMEVNLVGVKVLDKQGEGSTSSVLAGINWTIENKDRFYSYFFVHWLAQAADLARKPLTPD